MSDPILTTPRAVLLAGALIGIGLFFGLRDRKPEPAPGAPAAIPAAPQRTDGVAVTAPVAPNAADPSRAAQPTGAAPPRGEPGPAAPPGGAAAAAAANVTVVAKHASAAIDAHRAALLKACWEPSVKKSPTPPNVKLVFNFTFDAQGKQIIRGVHESRDASRPDVTSCVIDKLPPLEIPPPGANTYVEVPLTLP